MYNCSSNDPEKIKNLLQKTNYRAEEDLLNTTEYRDSYDGQRIYNSTR